MADIDVLRGKVVSALQKTRWQNSHAFVSGKLSIEERHGKEADAAIKAVLEGIREPEEMLGLERDTYVGTTHKDAWRFVIDALIDKIGERND